MKTFVLIFLVTFQSHAAERIIVEIRQQSRAMTVLDEDYFERIKPAPWIINRRGEPRYSAEPSSSKSVNKQAPANATAR